MTRLGPHESLLDRQAIRLLNTPDDLYQCCINDKNEAVKNHHPQIHVLDEQTGNRNPTDNQDHKKGFLKRIERHFFPHT